ncbi:MAG: hypothetical protein A2V51_05515 [Candidatus Dadabacteria bacterium RBG_19FT_COMBO_40_33]|nr:MAG: hypothetical protein A2V51_05515 [Candidatus Dadabacteria bacterium RBG_19FT_COMBO_40_33]
MRKNKKKISKFRSYEELGEFWDNHSLADYWDTTWEVHFDVDIKGHTKLVAIDDKISRKISNIARRRGISPETLINIWLQEKLSKEAKS